MTSTSTQNQLIQHVYGETPLFARLEMDFLLSQEKALKEEFKSLQSSAALLPKVKFSPSNKSLNAILNYSVAE